MKLEITEAFRQWQKQILKVHLRSDWLTIGDFIEALDTCVKPEAEGWVKDSARLGQRAKFIKGNYALVLLDFPNTWSLYECGADGIGKTKIAGTIPILTLEAQAWADQEIAKYEAEPTFGPGTRLRAENGDELVVIKLYGQSTYFAAVNLTGVTIERLGSHYWEERLTDLQAALTTAGATVIVSDSFDIAKGRSGG